MSIKHNKESKFADGNDSNLIGPSDWNAKHIVFPPLHQHYINKIPSKVSGSNRRFRTLNSYTSGMLSVWLNGLREKNIIEISDNQFEFTDDLETDDEVIVDYIKEEV